MNTLYELTDQYQSIMNMLYDGETDEQLVMDTLESIDGESRIRLTTTQKS